MRVIGLFTFAIGIVSGACPNAEFAIGWPFGSWGESSLMTQAIISAILIVVGAVIIDKMWSSDR